MIKIIHQKRKKIIKKIKTKKLNYHTKNNTKNMLEYCNNLNDLITSQVILRVKINEVYAQNQKENGALL